MSVPNSRFVVLEHRWEGVHWDLMLESGETLRTWALAAWPTPGPEIEAAALPDHRLAYLDYEGPVSGDRGEVRRIDQGTFEAIAWEAERVVVRLRGNQIIGLAELSRSDDDVGNASRRGWRFRMGKQQVTDDFLSVLLGMGPSTGSAP